MDEIQRLVRKARINGIKKPLARLRFSLFEDDHRLVVEKLERQKLSMSILFEAVCRGYVNNHPAVIGMLDDWIRERDDVDGPPQLFKNRKEIDAIYDEIGTFVDTER